MQQQKKIVPAADIKSRFSAYLKASENGPIVVTKNGKAVAVLLSVEDEEELDRLVLAYSPKFQKVLNNAKKQIRQTSGIPHEDFWKEVEQDPVNKVQDS